MIITSSIVTFLLTLTLAYFIFSPKAGKTGETHTEGQENTFNTGTHGTIPRISQPSERRRHIENDPSVSIGDEGARGQL
jgi:hypothetical protein